MARFVQTKLSTRVKARAWLLATTVLTSRVLSHDEITSKPFKICEETVAGPKCETKLHAEKIVCKNGLTHHSHREHYRAKTLIICLWSDATFSPQELLPAFRKLQKFSIRGGNLSDIVSDFPKSNLEALSLTDLPLEFVGVTTFLNLHHLKYLDLSRNQLHDLDDLLIFRLPMASKIFLAGNPWNCSVDLSPFLLPNISEKLGDVSKITCGRPYPGKPVKQVASLIQAMEKECPSKICTCSMPHIVWDTEVKFLHPVIVVNCSFRSLHAMPRQLPVNTTTLYLDHNNISDVAPLVRSSIYRRVLDVYVDHNSISNVDILEGSDWLRNFRIFSIKGNLIRQIPTYAFDHGFEMNENLGKVYLGGNPWLCNCDFTPAFQHLMIKYESVVRDLAEIKCRELEDDEHSLMPIMELARNSICYDPESWVNPLDIVSGILACLIVLVLGKLLYDYWNFKKSGRLPWIVTKMP